MLFQPEPVSRPFLLLITVFFCSPVYLHHTNQRCIFTHHTCVAPPRPGLPTPPQPQSVWPQKRSMILPLPCHQQNEGRRRHQGEAQRAAHRDTHRRAEISPFERGSTSCLSRPRCHIWQWGGIWNAPADQCKQSDRIKKKNIMMLIYDAQDAEKNQPLPALFCHSTLTSSLLLLQNKPDKCFVQRLHSWDPDNKLWSCVILCFAFCWLCFWIV